MVIIIIIIDQDFKIFAKMLYNKKWKTFIVRKSVPSELRSLLEQRFQEEP